MNATAVSFSSVQDSRASRDTIPLRVATTNEGGSTPVEGLGSGTQESDGEHCHTQTGLAKASEQAREGPQSGVSRVGTIAHRYRRTHIWWNCVDW